MSSTAIDVVSLSDEAGDASAIVLAGGGAFRGHRALNRAAKSRFPAAATVFHQYVVETDARDALREHLEARGVASGIHYPVPIHRSDAYAEPRLSPGSLPRAEALAERICSLPLSPTMTDEEISHWLRSR